MTYGSKELIRSATQQNAMVQTVESDVALRQSSSSLGETQVCIACRTENSLTITIGLVGFFLVLAIGGWQQLPIWQIVLSSFGVGLSISLFARWASSSRLTLFDDELVLASNVHRRVVSRESILASNWSRKKTFQNGMLSGSQYTLEVAYETKSGNRTLNVGWWILNGKSHSKSQQLLSELNSKYTDDCSFAIRSSKRC